MERAAVEEYQRGFRPRLRNDHHKKIRGFHFAPFVSNPLQLIAELDILLLKYDVVGGADIDNLLKTSFDALRAPQHKNELPPKAKPETGEKPFFCLLEDDSLITSFKVTCDRVLEYQNRSDVFMMIHVKTKQTGKLPKRWLDMIIP
jgi:hypothetical protein